MTNYLGFINAMLEKRKQDIAEQIAAEEQAGKTMASIGSGIDTAVKGFTDTMKTNQTNDLYNDVMAKNPSIFSTTTEGGKTAFDAQMDVYKAQQLGKSSSSGYKTADQMMQESNYNQTSPGAIESRKRWEYEQTQQNALREKQLGEQSSKTNTEISKITEEMAKYDPKDPLTRDKYNALNLQLNNLTSGAQRGQINTGEYARPQFIEPLDQKLLAAKEKALQSYLRSEPQTYTKETLPPFVKAQAALEGSGLPTQMGPGGIPISGQRPQPITVPAQTYERTPAPLPPQVQGNVSSTGESTSGTPAPSGPRPGWYTDPNGKRYYWDGTRRLY